MNLPDLALAPKISEGLMPFAIQINLAETPAMNKLWEYISTAKNDPVSLKSSLVGNISSSLVLQDTDNWFFENICFPLITEYRTAIDTLNIRPFFSQIVFKNKIDFVLQDLWVNFQKQHEFNPKHNHTGLWSFVIFMKIPYDWREQYEIPFIKESGDPRAGNFEFVYSDAMNHIRTYAYKLDSSSEGTMVFFPAEMNHQVFPFYNCEEERISISGNIAYDG